MFLYMLLIEMPSLSPCKLNSPFYSLSVMKNVFNYKISIIMLNMNFDKNVYECQTLFACVRLYSGST